MLHSVSRHVAWIQCQQCKSVSEGMRAASQKLLMSSKCPARQCTFSTAGGYCGNRLFWVAACIGGCLYFVVTAELHRILCHSQTLLKKEISSRNFLPKAEPVGKLYLKNNSVWVCICKTFVHIIFVVQFNYGRTISNLLERSRGILVQLNGGLGREGNLSKWN